MIKTKNVCSLFGHREVNENIEKRLSIQINDAIIKHNVEMFLVGGDGQFDEIAAGIVRRAKEKHPSIRLILVRPYLTKKLEENKEYYYENYDDIIIPEELLGTYYRFAITKRNRWMVDHSECVIIYSRHKYGGAYAAFDYADKQQKLIYLV